MIIPSANHLTKIPELNRPVTSLKGIGAKRAELLEQKGLHTLLDIIFFIPIRYEDRSRLLYINEVVGGTAVLVRGNVVSAGGERSLRGGRRLFRIIISDETAELELLWFHYKKAHLSRFALPGLELMAYGSIQMNRGKRQMIHPDITTVNKEKENETLGFCPVYRGVKGLSGRVLRSAISQALDQCQEALVDGIPPEITSRLGLPMLGEAIRRVHFPVEGSSIDLLNQFKTKYHQRLTFDRFFGVMLNIALRKKSREERAGLVFSIPEDLPRSVEKHFPFSLTSDQNRAIHEILSDLAGDKPMNRLLQGDVGCGKTVVAAVASYATVLNHWQVAIMVPTLVLAQQHYRYFSRLPEGMGFCPVLLTGALSKTDRLKTYEKIKRCEYNLIIGTQALIQEDLSFARLGLVVIDEQHRFGVRQRGLLDKKGVNSHLLVMTATPIPRTLAMTVYADMDISIIREYPEGHQPVVTYLKDETRKREVYDILGQEMSKGRQGIVVCPVIEGSEEIDLKNALATHERFKEIFSDSFRVGLIHGRLSSEEKGRVMEQFRDGRIDLLIGTTVIEVGVHALGATVMVVEHPERFGLAQLHQLRGRVGRGASRGICLLMLSVGLSEETLSRLNVLVETHDGFEIAQKDLEMRGQGELMGIRQAGAGELHFEEMFREADLLITAKREAGRLLDSDPELSDPENAILRDMIGEKSHLWVGSLS